MLLLMHKIDSMVIIMSVKIRATTFNKREEPVIIKP